MQYFRYLLFIVLIGLLTIFCMPIFLFRPFSHRNSSLFLKLMGIFITPLMGFKITIQAKEKLLDNLPGIAIGNHQHNFDILVASKAFNERVVSLGKSQIAFLPFFGQIFPLAGNFLINRSNPQKAMASMMKMEKYLKQNSIAVAIFPEGHRNPTDQLLPFKKGAFYSAIKTGVPLLPFCVSNYPKGMNLNRWVSANVIVKYLDPIPTKGLTTTDVPELMERARDIIQKEMDVINRNNRA